MSSPYYSLATTEFSLYTDSTITEAHGAYNMVDSLPRQGKISQPVMIKSFLSNVSGDSIKAFAYTSAGMVLNPVYEGDGNQSDSIADTSSASRIDNTEGKSEDHFGFENDWGRKGTEKNDHIIDMRHGRRKLVVAAALLLCLSLAVGATVVSISFQLEKKEGMRKGIHRS